MSTASATNSLAGFRRIGDRARAIVPVAINHALDLIDSATKSDLATWIGKLESLGVDAKRHCSPDLMAQLRQSAKRPIDTILCSACDDDPSDSIQTLVALGFAREIIAGVRLCAQLSSATRELIVSAGAADVLRRASAGTSIRFSETGSDYPRADPSILLSARLNRRLRPGRLPTEAGVIVLDAVSAMALGRAALLNEARLVTPVSVSDHTTGQSIAALAPADCSLNDLLEELGMNSKTMVCHGAVLRDDRIDRSALLRDCDPSIHLIAEGAPDSAGVCVRCGWCVEVCPTRVQPAMALEAAQRADEDLAERAGIHACTECGLCSFVCPSRLPLLPAIRQLRDISHNSANPLKVER